MNKLFTTLALICMCYTVSAQIPQNGLVAFYPFDFNGKDDGPNNYHGDTINASTSGDRLSRLGRAIDLTGGSCKIKIPVGSKLRFTNQFTLSMWLYVRTSQTQSYPSAFKFGNAGNTVNYIDLGFNLLGAPTGGGSISTTSSTNYKVYTNIGSSDLNKWRHIVLVYDSTSLKLYLDTALVNFGSVSGKLSFTPKDTIMTFGGWGLNSSIDDAAFYNRALNSNEIQALFKDTVSLVCSQHTASITASGSTLTASNGASYQWYKDNVIIANAINSTYVSTQAGSYTCEIKTVAGCAKMSNALQIEGKIPTSGLSKSSENQFTISPNPASTFIELNTTQSFDQIQIIAQDGRIVKSIEGSTKTIDVSDLESGMYIITTMINGEISNQKLIKE